MNQINAGMEEIKMYKELTSQLAELTKKVDEFGRIVSKKYLDPNLDENNLKVYKREFTVKTFDEIIEKYGIITTPTGIKAINSRCVVKELRKRKINKVKFNRSLAEYKLVKTRGKKYIRATQSVKIDGEVSWNYILY